MNYCELSPDGEKLLQEILALQAGKEKNDDHWNARFDSLSCAEDDLLRSVFKELRENGYINVQWAGDIPYYLSVTVDGKNYFENKKKAKKEAARLTRREWKIAIVSAVVGALIGLIPWFVTLMGGGQ